MAVKPQQLIVRGAKQVGSVDPADTKPNPGQTDPPQVAPPVAAQDPAAKLKALQMARYQKNQQLEQQGQGQFVPGAAPGQVRFQRNPVLPSPFGPPGQMFDRLRRPGQFVEKPAFLGGGQGPGMAMPGQPGQMGGASLGSLYDPMSQMPQGPNQMGGGPAQLPPGAVPRFAEGYNGAPPQMGGGPAPMGTPGNFGDVPAAAAEAYQQAKQGMPPTPQAQGQSSFGRPGSYPQVGRRRPSPTQY